MRPTRGVGGPPHLPLPGLAPGGVCLASLSPGCRPALTRPLHPYCRRWSNRPQRYLSVALSLGSPPLGITQHPALWSPDFPRAP